MGYGGINIGYGIQRLIDAQMRYLDANRVPVSMRFRDFVPPTDQLYAQLGYVITPDSGGAGTTDVLINPPCSTRLVSMHNIGMSQGKLRFGAREFTISQSFINAQQLALGLATPEQLWLSKQLVGLVGYGVLWSIELYASDDVGGIPVVWTVTANANELR
jgi:hypothetical protein